MLRGQMYRLDILDRDGSRVGVKELERQLFAIGQDCLASSRREASVGILTAGKRDGWQEAYEIMRLDEENAANFKLVHESILVLCLDDSATGTKLDKSHRQIFHNESAENRWYEPYH